MGDRFYLSQLKATGKAPGAPLKQRKRQMAWTDEKKAEVIAAYEAAEPTAENSMEIVKQIAEDFEESPNGVRMILTKAGVYVKKSASPAAAKTSAASSGDKPARVSKADSQAALTAAITDLGQEIDEDVISKLTGKAAVYFANILSSVKG